MESGQSGNNTNAQESPGVSGKGLYGTISGFKIKEVFQTGRKCCTFSSNRNYELYVLNQRHNQLFVNHNWFHFCWGTNDEEIVAHVWKESWNINTLIPQDISQLRAFLGMVNYYSRFMPNLAQVLATLYQLLQDEPGQWNNKKVSNELKN